MRLRSDIIKSMHQLMNQLAIKCYERAQPSTETRVLGAGLGPIGPSAPLPSVHIAFAPR